MKTFKMVSALLTCAAVTAAAAVPAFADTEKVDEVVLNPGANIVMQDYFEATDLPSYVTTKEKATIENGMLKLTDGASFGGIRLPKNSAIEFDIMSETDKVTGTLTVNTRKDNVNKLNPYTISYQSRLGGDGNYYGRFIANAVGSNLWEPDIIKATLPNYVASNTTKNHIKYVTYEDRLAIFYNGRLVGVCTDENVNKDGGLYNMYATYAAPDGSAVYIDHLKITKADLTDYRDLYVSTVGYNENFDGEDPGFLDGNKMTDGKLKMLSGKYFGKNADGNAALWTPLKGFVEFDLEAKRTDENNAGEYDYSLYVFQYGSYRIRFKYLVNGESTLQINVPEATSWNDFTNVYKSSGKVRVRVQTDANKVSTLFVNGQKVIKWDNTDDINDDVKLVGSLEDGRNADTYIDNFLTGTGLPEEAITGYKPEELTIYSAGGAVITRADDVQADGSYVVKTHVTNTTNTDKRATVCVGIYDGNGYLKKVKFQDITVEAGAFDKAVEVPFQAEGITTHPIIKAFMFDGIDTITPVIANTTLLYY